MDIVENNIIIKQTGKLSPQVTIVIETHTHTHTHTAETDGRRTISWLFVNVLIIVLVCEWLIEQFVVVVFVVVCVDVMLVNQHLILQHIVVPLDKTWIHSLVDRWEFFNCLKKNKLRTHTYTYIYIINISFPRSLTVLILNTKSAII